MNHQKEKALAHSTVRPKRIAIYVIYDKDGILDSFRKYYLTELNRVVDYVLAVVCGTLTPESRDELEKIVDEIYVRENKGLLAGAWVDGIAHIGWDTLDTYDELFMLNDSFFGPLYPLEDMVDAMEKSDADFYGAIKNFEEKDWTSFHEKTFRHGHLRGSVCYFYIIKQRLLHSPEFKKYWSAEPAIECDADTFFFSEFDFYDYVYDAGFRIETFQGDSLKGYCSDNLSLNVNKLIQNEKVPFARIRPFGSDMLNLSLQAHYGKDIRNALKYIDEETNYDANFIWDYLLRTKNPTDIWHQLQLEYVVPKDFVEHEFRCKKKIAVILHIYYEELIDHILSYCVNFRGLADFYVTVVTEDAKIKVLRAFQKNKLKCICTVRPNVGVAMSTLWVTYADVTLNDEYEYICYFHDKKSPYWSQSIEGEQFAERCYENLMGTPEIVKNIINLFEMNPRLGMLGPPRVYHGHYFNIAMTTWPNNYANVEQLADKMNIRFNGSQNTIPVAPYGDMFWFRAAAMHKAMSNNFSYRDFDIDYVPDGTILHAMERLYGFIVHDSGYYYAEVINLDNARADLVNYQYMIYQICALLYDGINVPYSFEEVKNIILRYKQQQPSLRKAIKERVKHHIPKPIWAVMKKIYHFFGGKKWVG